VNDDQPWALVARSTRSCLGCLLVNAMTGQLITNPTDPYAAPPGPVSRSGRVATRLRI